MDLPNLRVIFKYYDQHLGQLGILPEKTHLKVGNSPLAQARWMCQVALKEYLPQKRIQKSMRWLGFVQGVLYMAGVFSISELCRHNLTNGSEGDGLLTKERSDAAESC